MMTIAIANQKGGCGKTTTAINLAACLGQQQQRTLLIDMDPQGHASLGMGLQREDQQGLYEVLMCEADINDVIIPDVSNGVDIVPATISLAAVEQLLSKLSNKDLQLLLHLEGLNTDYDFVILDCPPQLGLLSFNALRAADQLLIPLEMSSFALDGVERLSDTLSLLRERFDADIPVRILPTMVDYRTRFTNIIMDDVYERFPDDIISDPIHYTVRVKEAAYHGKAIIDFEPRSPAANDYRQLSEAIMATCSSAQNVLSETKQRFREMSIPSETAATNPDTDTIPIDTDIRDPAISSTTSDSDGNDDIQSVVLAYVDSDIDSLEIAGEFNNWIPDHNIDTLRSDGIIKKVLQIPAGQYQYRLVIDGKWQKDPNNPHQTLNDYGEINSLLRVTAMEGISV